jgi:hypothetical protein
MGQVPHGCATTTEAVRRAIQHSQESLRALAKRYGINQKTVAKRKKRGSVVKRAGVDDSLRSPHESARLRALTTALMQRASRNPPKAVAVLTLAGALTRIIPMVGQLPFQTRSGTRSESIRGRDAEAVWTNLIKQRPAAKLTIDLNFELSFRNGGQRV